MGDMDCNQSILRALVGLDPSFKVFKCHLVLS